MLLNEILEHDCFLPDSSRPSCEASPQQGPRGIAAHDKKMGTNERQEQLMAVSVRAFGEPNRDRMKTISIVQELILCSLVAT